MQVRTIITTIIIRTEIWGDWIKWKGEADAKSPIFDPFTCEGQVRYRSGKTSDIRSTMTDNRYWRHYPNGFAFEKPDEPEKGHEYDIVEYRLLKSQLIQESQDSEIDYNNKWFEIT